MNDPEDYATTRALLELGRSLGRLFVRTAERAIEALDAQHRAALEREVERRVAERKRSRPS